MGHCAKYHNVLQLVYIWIPHELESPFPVNEISTGWPFIDQCFLKLSIAFLSASQLNTTTHSKCAVAYTIDWSVADRQNGAVCSDLGPGILQLGYIWIPHEQESLFPRWCLLVTSCSKCRMPKFLPTSFHAVWQYFCICFQLARKKHAVRDFVAVARPGKWYVEVTNISVRPAYLLLGPCFKTGQWKPFRMHTNLTVHVLWLKFFTWQ